MHWTSPISKTLNITGNVGPADNNNPAVRINSGGQGEITMNILSGGQTVRGWPGLGGAGGNNGQGGGTAMVVSSPIKMPTSHHNGRVGGGGGGGGGGGQGGQGGSGGHSGGRRCNPGFCWNTHQYCNNNGGCGGTGGAGGTGGRGDGYYYDFGNNYWVITNLEKLEVRLVLLALVEVVEQELVVKVVLVALVEILKLKWWRRKPRRSRRNWVWSVW